MFHAFPVWLTRIIWALMASLAVYLALQTTMYFSFSSTWNFLGAKQDVAYYPPWRVAFYIHITGGLLALAVGPFQFVGYLRRKFRALHRGMGKVYLVSILILGAPTGFFMALYAEGGWVGQAGFTLMAFVWMYTTYKAYETVRRGDYIAHRNWMTRSFALTFAAVTLRIFMPVSTYVFQMDGFLAEAMSAWVSWLPNLLVAELLIQRFPKKL